MRILITQALNEAVVLLNKQTPETKKKLVEVNLTHADVSPMELPSFMKDNGIPSDAYFGASECNTLGGSSDVLLLYSIEVPTTDKDKLEFRNRRFTDIAFKLVYDTLTANGYVRTPVNSARFKDFADTTVYTMFTTGDFDRLVDYYSMYFKSN